MIGSGGAAVDTGSLSHPLRLTLCGSTFLSSTMWSKHATTHAAFGEFVDVIRDNVVGLALCSGPRSAVSGRKIRKGCCSGPDPRENAFRMSSQSYFRQSHDDGNRLPDMPALRVRGHFRCHMLGDAFENGDCFVRSILVCRGFLR
jgi:hypothetical protein